MCLQAAVSIYKIEVSLFIDNLYIEVDNDKPESVPNIQIGILITNQILVEFLKTFIEPLPVLFFLSIFHLLLVKIESSTILLSFYDFWQARVQVPSSNQARNKSNLGKSTFIDTEWK